MTKKEDILYIENLPVLQNDYIKDITTNPLYSLEVDPENKYNMSDTHKEFIQNYVAFKNIPLAAELTKIDEDVARAYFMSPIAQAEIKRINRAKYHRMFATRMLSLDEVGGYLTSLLMDENVAYSEKLSPKDKLTAAKLIIEINNKKAEAFNGSNVIDNVDINEQFSKLTIDAIEQMLSVSDMNKKNDIIDQLEIKNPNLTEEEKMTLRSMSLNDLVELANEIAKK